MCHVGRCNHIVCSCHEEKLNQYKSMEHQQETTDQYNMRIMFILPMHEYMCAITLKIIFNESVIEKRYWLMTIKESRECVNKCLMYSKNLQ